MNSHMTPLRHLESIEGYRNLFIKDESVNPNGTFKDRLSIRALECYEPPVTFGVISYGNTAVSLARAIRRHSANQSFELVVFVPSEFGSWSFGPSSHGTYLSGEGILRQLELSSSTISLDLTQSLTDSDLRILAMEAGLGRSRFINVTEGLEVPAYVNIIIEVVAQLGRPPDICVVPFGAGILCNEIKDYLYKVGHGVVIPISVACRNSLARMLYGPLWVDTELLGETGVAYSRHFSPDRTGAERQPYPVFLIREDEIARGLEIARTTAISAEPSGSAGLGVLHRLDELCPGLDRKRDTVVVINTGNGIDGFYRGVEQIECV
jgi:pyridoxal-phosphate dependent enzyme